MPKINLLPQHISELIAAGEVVERPSSVIKELVENSIDAGATAITVEIQRGGILYMRITDNGCGISHSDVPLAFMRHATSKISTDEDLNSIATLGFRGEALAATASVSKVEMFSKQHNTEIGTHYVIEGGSEMLYEESGCPDGTTIIVRDLFYNTPARMKFLKKDVSEGNAVSAVIERLAISHPEISFKLIREGKQVMSTAGDSKLESAIYSVLGREFSKSLIPLKSEGGQISVDGFICKPVFCRQSRAGQYIFLNSRLVHSDTVTAAVEQAYKNSSMVGKFPAFVINVKVPFDSVDVNVHPAKTEIRFSDERKIFDEVYYAVKNAIAQGDTRPNVAIKPMAKAVMPSYSTNDREYKQEKIVINEKPVTTDNKPFLRADITPNINISISEKSNVDRLNDSSIPIFYKDNFSKTETAINEQPPKFDEHIPIAEDKSVQNISTTVESNGIEIDDIRFVGEAFLTYIIVEYKSSIYLIDKHAAHERILFNKLKKEQTVETQQLLTPVTVRLSTAEHDAILTNADLLIKSGFELEDFGNSSVIVRAIPATLLSEDVTSVIFEVAESLAVKNTVEIDALDRLFHTVACKAAIKAGYKTTDTELLDLAKRVLCDKDVMYCPHGRPVAYELKKSELEKQFGRIQ